MILTIIYVAGNYVFVTAIILCVIMKLIYFIQQCKMWIFDIIRH